jgi:Rrf2 family protein
VYISARVDYATRALLTLAAAAGEPLTADQLAATQHLPVRFLENILTELRRAELVTSQRGRGAGYRLARPAEDISVADVIRALEGPLAEVHGLRPESAVYDGAAAHLQDVWVAVRASLRAVLEAVTLSDIVAGRLPAAVTGPLGEPDAWVPRPLR